LLFIFTVNKEKSKFLFVRREVTIRNVIKSLGKSRSLEKSVELKGEF